jgi:uncharacterized membrane protein YciS (DUF1049 family)
MEFWYGLLAAVFGIGFMLGMIFVAVEWEDKQDKKWKNKK